MTYPIGSTGEVGGPDGYSYGAVLVRPGAAERTRVEEVLRRVRFSGWIGPSQGEWLVVLGDPGAGVVAAERRGIIEVGGAIAQATEAAVFAVRVRRDRQLAIVAWRDGAEIGRYASDPSQEPGADDDVIAEPVGVASAFAFAGLAGREDAADDLAELLGEELDPDSVYESERLRHVLRLLGMPDWIVAANALPRDIPTGPRAAELVRLRGGRTGFEGWARHAFIRRLRRGRVAPPAIPDPPRQSEGMGGIEPWMF
ncbi:hypothetical protein G5T42_10605 [Microbacterium sp. 4R-513]|uniref:hypothetical protein n=1 Tax=Microbacterium sp. 4R-513 TaxID=2567934 RepID=UPI0013E1123C|nr:hypothetical protein [Microbacterium sp. 4R-513]QIG39879.1 hypothetical protein G5T42_10605 [Microbacterium sp. 4R-513]